MKLERKQNGLDIYSEAGKPLFHYAADPRYRTHLHPVYVPGTREPMTRFRPADHPWQFGVFVGLNKVNGLDFWCSGEAVYPPEERGTMHVQDLRVHSERGDLSFTGVSEWRDPRGRPVLEEYQHIGVPEQSDCSEAFVIDFTWELHGKHGPVHVAESPYGGLSVRLVGEGETRRHLNANGHTGADCADQAARWTSVAQPVDNVGTWIAHGDLSFAYAGIAVFDHPSNPGFPNRWRVDPHGMINPCLAKSRSWDIPEGERVRFAHRLYAFRGVENGDAIEAAYRIWTGE